MKWHRLLLTATASLYLAALGRDQFDAWVEATHIPSLLIETGVEVRDRDGGLLRAYQVDNGRWRLAVGVANVDPDYIRMLVAFEDKRFYNHGGIDPVALIRAVGQAIKYRKVVSGASTLTMQTARLLEGSGTGRWNGKLRQARLALALERRLSKSDILTLYLQRAPFGGNLEGVRAASLAYFGREPARLTPAQAALLVALPQAPEARRPDRHPQVARMARDRVLARMFEAGVIDAETTKTAATELSVTKRIGFPQIAPHLSDRLAGAANNARIDTTIKADLQRALQQLARQSLDRLDPRLSIAIIAADHQTGEVLASVGSADFTDQAREGYVDMTRALRSPGSTLKPFVYGIGFDKGMIHPETLVDDAPHDFNGYSPQNFDGQFRGQIRVRSALQQSLNLPVVSLLDAAGPANLTALLGRSGVDAQIPGGKPGLAIGLGGLGVSLHDMVQLYAGLARGGQGITLSELSNAEALPLGRLISQKSAWYLADILSGIAPPPNARPRDIAYKTGTSYGHRDAWSIGYDGRHVIGVWMGRPDGTPVPGAFGAGLAAPVLFEAFERLKQRPDPLPAAPADALTVSNAELPKPLRAFQSSGQALVDPDRPQIAFPPDGARIAAGNTGLFVQIRNGVPPFHWLANGAPIATQSWDRQVELSAPGRGFLTVTVVDAKGRSANTQVFVD